jgi:very-short-patch-repair endonuclease
VKVTRKQATALGLEMPKTRKLSPAEKLVAKAKREALEDWFEADFARRYGAGRFVREHRFHPSREWRFDFADLGARVAIEVDGGTHNGGRHVRGTGFAEDRRKRNEAVRLGWRVLEFDARMVRSGEAAEVTGRVLGLRGVGDGG